MSEQQLFRGEDLEQFVTYRTVDLDHCIACHGTNPEPWAKWGSYDAVRCPRCGLIWMKPYLNEEGLAKYYADYIGRRRLSNEVKMRQRSIQYGSDRTFIEHFVSDGKVLDIGCSGGFFLSALSDEFEKHGIEIDPEAVAYARANQPFGENVVCTSLHDAPYADESFGLVTMRGTIEHLADPVAAIEKVSQLLAPGGYYYITATPNGACFAAELYREQWTLFHPVQHIWHFSPKTLGLICERVGLKLLATDLPYLGTPYENVREDVQAVAQAVVLREQDPNAELSVSPPFFESMMGLVFQKV